VPSFKLKSSWVTILQGVEFSIFPLILAWALQQCSADALPVIDGLTAKHLDLFVGRYYHRQRSSAALL